MRYFFFALRMVAVSFTVGIAGAVLLSSSVLAASPTYTVLDGVVTIKDTSYGTMTIPKGKTKSSNHGSCSGISNGPAGVTTYSVYVEISSSTRSLVDGANPPASITYTASPSSPTSTAKCNEGGTAKWIAPEAVSDPDGDDAYANAATQSLIGKRALLRDSAKYRGTLSGSDITKAVSECIDTATAKATPPTNQDFADCYASKTGKSATDIKDYLDEIGDPVADAVEAGEAARDDKLGITEDEKTCGSTLSGIGWFVCSVTEKFIDFVDGVWNQFEKLLIADPLNDSDTYDTWKNFRNIANTLLVVVFIFIIYSQITGLGASNYGVKKMLPKLVIATIAINLSYILMQLSVDVANVLGKIIDNLLTDQVSSVPYGDGDWGFVWDGVLAAGGIATVGVGASAAITIAGPAAIMFIALLLIPAAIGVIAGLLALMFRSAIIPILAILAPVAFVAWILPNTNKLFEKWKSTFTGMIFLYPLASAYYGGLKFAALMIMGSKDSNSFERVTAIALLSMGPFVVLVLAVKSNSIMRGIIGSVSGAVNRLTGGLVGYAMGSAKGRMALNREQFKAGAEPDVSGSGRRFGRFGVGALGNRISRAYHRSGQRQYERQVATSIAKGDAEQRYQGAILDDQAGFAARTGVDFDASTTGKGYMSSLTAKAIQNEEAKIRTADIDALAEALESAIKGSDTIAAQAAQNQLLRRGSGGLEAFNTTIGANPARGDLRSDLAANIRDNHAGVMDKDWGTREWATAKSDPNDPSKQDMTMQQAQDKAHGRVAQSGMSTEEFAGLSTKAQERVLSDDGARSKLSTVTLQTLGDESTTLGAKISQDIRDQLNNEIGLRGGVSRERKKPLDARARQRK